MSSTDVTTPNPEIQVQDASNQQATAPTNGDATKDPYKKYQLQWQEYYASLGNDKQKLITKLAPQESFKVPFRDGSTKKYKRQRLATREFVDLEKRRAKFRKNKDPEESTDILMDLYQKVAEYGLINPDTEQGMSKEEYGETVWEDAYNQAGIKTILDSVNHRAVYGGAYFQSKAGSAVQ